MNIKKLDQLIEKLGMTSEIKPLLESNADGETGYERFERSVGEVLEKYKGKGGRIKVKEKRKIYPYIPQFAVNYCLRSSGNFPLPQKPEIIDVETYKSTKKFERNIDYFKRNYGINCEPETLRKISEKENISANRVGQISNHVLCLLKSKHKKDIWYKTL